MLEDDIVLVITNSDEHSIQGVLDRLIERGQNHVRLNTDQFIDCGMRVSIHSLDPKSSRIVFSEDREIKMGSVKSVWYRRPGSIETRLRGNDALCKQFVEDEFGSTLWSLFTTMDWVYWMNQPLYARYWIEHNKLLQIKLAKEEGIDVPPTVITNDPEELLSFCRSNNGHVAIKTVRSRIFQSSDGTADGIYTQKINVEKLLECKDGISSAPMIAQSYIKKKFELRITVVGDKIFACSIDSQSSEKTNVDWRRYDFNKVRHQQFNLPDWLEAKLLSLMKKCKLEYGAIDMIVTPEDEYVFLEINQCGQYGWIEGLTGMPISDAIAQALVNGIFKNDPP